MIFRVLTVDPSGEYEEQELERRIEVEHGAIIAITPVVSSTALTGADPVFGPYGFFAQ